MLTMVNMNKPKLTLLQQDILRVLYKHAGQALNQRQIANRLAVTSPAVMKALPLLEKAQFALIHKDKETKRLSISLNAENRRMIQLKRVDNLKQVYESGLADFLEQQFAGGTVILFGSYSLGEDLFNSDIDIAVIGRNGKEVDMTDFEKVLERKIHILFYESFKKINENLKNSILNGIVLAGSVEL